MTSTKYLTFLFFVLASSVLPGSERPNIVVFISDDLGRWETSIHGNPDVKTPTMDRLAAQGMVFENAYVASPSCCPNRFSLLTGLMPARHGAHPNHSQPKPGTEFLLPILQSMGYYVASFGKVAHGRNEMKGVDFQSPPPREMHKNIVKHFDGKTIDKPVCLLVGDRRPHVSWTKEFTYEPESLTLPSWLIDTSETREHWARYLTDISGMDAEMKRVYDWATERFDGDFIFVFTSDHGGQWPRGKWNLYDSGSRVPMIVSWPGHVPNGARTDAMTSWVDIIPTLIDLAGGSAPSNIDGMSFAAVLLDKQQSHRDKIYTTHTGDGKMNIFPIRSVRIGPYKYIHNLRPDAYHTNHSDRHRKDGAGAYWDSWDEAARTDPKAAEIIRRYYTRDEFELFDLSNDEHELKNLANKPEHQSTLKKLRDELSAWTLSQGDDMKPHQDPYLVTQPIPIIEDTPRKQRKK